MKLPRVAWSGEWFGRPDKDDTENAVLVRVVVYHVDYFPPSDEKLDREVIPGAALAIVEWLDKDGMDKDRWSEVDPCSEMAVSLLGTAVAQLLTDSVIQP